MLTLNWASLVARKCLLSFVCHVLHLLSSLLHVHLPPSLPSTSEYLAKFYSTNCFLLNEPVSFFISIVLIKL